MKLIHWFCVVSVVVSSCQLLLASESDTLSKPISKSGEITAEQLHFMARSLKKKKKYRAGKRPRPIRYPQKPSAYRNIEGSHSIEEFGKSKSYGYGGSHGGYGAHSGYAGYSSPYYAASTYTQPIIYNSGDYGAGYFKPLLFLLIIPLVIIVAAAGAVAVVNSSSSSAATATANQQQQQQESNNNNNNANNDNNNNAIAAVVSSNTATTYTSPVIIIINATGRAHDEKLNFAKPTWLNQFFD